MALKVLIENARQLLTNKTGMLFVFCYQSVITTIILNFPALYLSEHSYFFSQDSIYAP